MTGWIGSPYCVANSQSRWSCPGTAITAPELEWGGFCHVATDWAPYAHWMVEVFSQSAAWENTSPEADFVPRPDRRPLTKFERRGERLGHDVFDLVYVRKASDQHL